MKKIVLFIFCGFSIQFFSQSKKQIDSLNNIPFNIRQEKASQLDRAYLLNVEKSKKINYKLGEGDSYSNLGLVYYYQGKLEKSLDFSLLAINKYESIGDNEKLCYELGELGYRMKKRNMPKALYYMQKAKNIAENKNFQKPLLSIYNNYGYLKELQNENDSAIHFYKKCLKMKEKIKDEIGIPFSLNYIALIYIKQNKFIEAKKLLERALKIRNGLKDQIGIAENNFYLGDLNLNQNRFQEAMSYYEKSLQIAIKNNYLDLIKSCYQVIAECHEKLGNNEESLSNFKKHIQFKDSILNKETNSKIAELEIQFETTKKEKQIIQQQAEAKQKNFYLIGLVILVILIGLIGFLIYKQQNQKNQQQEQEFVLKSAIGKIENQNKLQEQRLSISRDLHDNIGSQLTFIISSVDNVKYGFDIQNDKLNSKLSNISNFAKDTIVELRDTIWAMNSNEISFEDLEARINNYIEKAKEVKNQISFSFAIDDNLKSEKLTSIEGMNIYRTIQEAVNNSIKYANADIISINAKKIESTTKITISDNGIGFDFDSIKKGNGLNNMKKRIEEIDGKFILTSSNQGTKIEILI